jgi:hypothetical protein
MKRALALGVLVPVPLPASAVDASRGLQPMDVAHVLAWFEKYRARD